MWFFKFHTNQYWSSISSLKPNIIRIKILIDLPEMGPPSSDHFSDYQADMNILTIAIALISSKSCSVFKFQNSYQSISILVWYFLMTFDLHWNGKLHLSTFVVVLGGRKMEWIHLNKFIEFSKCIDHNSILNALFFFLFLSSFMLLQDWHEY